MDDLMRRQLLVELKRAVYRDAYYSEEHDAVFPMDKEFPGIQIRDKEIWMPRLEQPPYILGQPAIHKSELEQQQRDLVYQVFRPITDRVEEMVYAWRNAFPMKAQDVEEFRLLSEHGKIVLAARDDGERGLHFTTWEYDYNRTGVGHGHYTTDYEGAKRDFAVRSGLIPEKLIFAKEELEQIYSALVFQGKNDDELTFDKERELRGVIGKLETISPELKDTLEAPAQENEPEPEQ